MTPTCLVAVSLDVECDKDERWRVRRPLTFRGVEEGIGACLTPLFQEYGARPTYLVSPEVMRNPDSAALLKAIEVCELGAHLHPEFVHSSEGVMETTAVACTMAETEERRDMEALTSAFADVFGRPPLSYRAGRYGASARSLRILAGLGYAIDSSVTPHMVWGYGPDFRGAPSFPYYPDATDITRPGAPGGLLEVPVSLRPSSVPRLVREAARVVALSQFGPTRRIAGWARNPLWFRPGWSTRNTLLAFVRDTARGGYEGDFRGVLNMMFHNVDVVPGCSPNSSSERGVRTALDDLRAVLEKVLACGGRFATLTEIRDSMM
jgi:hypothetical protein